jgi:multicomponent Na+:H+ antiporter subunit F
MLVVLAGVFCCLGRMLRGPSPFDRVLAFEAIALNFVGLTVLVSILLDTNAYIDVVLVVALLGFLGTVSIAAYLEGTLVDS